LGDQLRSQKGRSKKVVVGEVPQESSPNATLKKRAMRMNIIFSRWAKRSRAAERLVNHTSRFLLGWGINRVCANGSN
jgi:hypothetical protein